MAVGGFRPEQHHRPGGHAARPLRKRTGKIVLPFTAGEVNLVMQPAPSGSGAVTVLLDGMPVGEAHGADIGADAVARFDD